MGAKRILKPSHSANMRAFRPMPTTPRAMRHTGQAAKKGDRKNSQIVSLVSDRLTFAEYGETSPYPRHSQGINRRAHDTQSAMRHFEKKGGHFLGEQEFLKLSHSANMREFRPMPTTPRDMRHIGQAAKMGDRKDSQTVSLVSDRLTFAEYGESCPCPRYPDGDLPPVSPPTGERCGECDSPKIHFLPSYRFLLLCVLCGEYPSPVVGRGLG